MPLTTGLLLAVVCAVLGYLLASLSARRASAAGQAALGRVPALDQALASAHASRLQLETTLATREQALQASQQHASELGITAARATSEAESQRTALASLHADLLHERETRQSLLQEQQRLASALASAEVELRKERENSSEKLAVLNEAREQLTHQFRALASDILEEKSQKFAEQNAANLDQLLLPLKTQLTDFKGTVERVYVEEGEKRVALSEQVKQLAALNAQLSADATDLTRALKGSTKAQGNWGEVVLERILESGGLRKDHEYRVQESHTREDGSRAVPDVILHLPDGRHLVIDSKVSLTDYNDHVNAPSDEHRESATTAHLNSVRKHFRGLSEKDYRSLHTLNTVDFVIMFVPIEPAFMLAISRDPNLWTQAWEKNVLLVSPSTLLFVVRTVSHIWKQEQQRNQWQEIARQGGDLYDKFSAFVADLGRLGEQLAKAQQSYDLAFNKLKTGRGNLINRADTLRRMGLKVTKPLPDNLTEAANESANQSAGDLPSTHLPTPFPITNPTPLLPDLNTPDPNTPNPNTPNPNTPNEEPLPTFHS